MTTTINWSLKAIAMIGVWMVVQCNAAENPRKHVPANPSRAEVAKHRTISSWTRATFELEHGYALKVERSRERVTKMEVVKDGHVYVAPNEFYRIATYVDFTRARVTRTDDPNDTPKVVRNVDTNIADQKIRQAEFYLSLSFQVKDELESEGVRFMAFADSPVLVMFRSLGNPRDLNEDLPRGPGAVTIASAICASEMPNQLPVPTAVLRTAVAHR